MATNVQLDAERLLAQLKQLSEVGLHTSGGRTRLALSDEDKLARDLVISWMRELDLEVRVDRVGNIFALLPGKHPGAPLLIGSHIDTVNNAGPLDGCYGVLSGLAVVRAFRFAGVVPARSLAVAVFTNEEGVRFHPDLTGSLTCARGITPEAAWDLVDANGIRLGDELQRIGYVGDMEPGSLLPAAYLELHIEQGPILESEGLDIGVVTSVQGLFWQRLTIRGQSAHAGACPLHLRHDAGYAAARIIVGVRDISRKFETVRATVGTLSLHPGSINVVPGGAELTIDLREMDQKRLEQAEQAIADLVRECAAEEGVTITSEPLTRVRSEQFDPAWMDRVEGAAQRLGISYRRMPSGAVHDAMMMSRICPAVMIFVPSVGGISHNPAEHTDKDQLVKGAQVLLETARTWMNENETA